MIYGKPFGKLSLEAKFLQIPARTAGELALSTVSLNEGNEITFGVKATLLKR